MKNWLRGVMVLLAAVVIAFCSGSGVCAEEYEYDELNRVKKVTYEDGSTAEYFYDSNGNILEISVNKAACILELYSRTEAGAEEVAQVTVLTESQNGKFYAGDSVTVKAEDKTQDGFLFCGWYQVKTVEGKRVSAYDQSVLSTELEYTFIIQKNTALVAVYKPAANVSVKIECVNGAAFRIAGDSTVNSTVVTKSIPEGKLLSLIADDPDRVYLWQEESGKILGNAGRLDYIVREDTTIRLIYRADDLKMAVYSRTEDSAAPFAEVSYDFEDFYYHSYQSSDYFASGDCITVRAADKSEEGYVFCGWYKVNTVKGEKVTSYDNGALSTNLNYSFLIAEDTSLVAVYRNNIHSAVRVNVETLAGAKYKVGNSETELSGSCETVLVGQKLVLKAADPDRVHHWENENGKILGTDATLEYKVMKESTVRLVYKPENEDQVLITVETEDGTLFYLESDNAARSGGTFLAPRDQYITLKTFEHCIWERDGESSSFSEKTYYTDDDIKVKINKKYCPVHHVLFVGEDGLYYPDYFITDDERQIWQFGGDSSFSMIWPEPAYRPGYEFEKWVSDYIYDAPDTEITLQYILEGKYDVYVKPKYRKVEGVRASCNLQLYFRCDHYNDDFAQVTRSSGEPDEMLFEGDIVTVTASERSRNGYIFDGWYEVKEWNRSIRDVSSFECRVLSKETEYTFTISEDTKLVAVYKPDKLKTVHVISENGARINSCDYDYEYKVDDNMIFYKALGDTVSLKVRDANNFYQWQNENGEVLGTDPELTFTVTGDMTVKAVYKPLIYLNVYSRTEDSEETFVQPSVIINREKEKINIGDEITISVPDKRGEGYVFCGWYRVLKTEDGKVTEYDSEVFSTEREYTFMPETDLNLVAVYRNNVEAKVTVEPLYGAKYRIPGDDILHDSTIILNTMIGQTITLSAEDEEKLCMWQDARGRTLGTGKTISFVVTEDTTVRLINKEEKVNFAVYSRTVDSEEAIAEVSFVSDDPDGTISQATPVRVKAPDKSGDGYAFCGWYVVKAMEGNRVTAYDSKPLSTRLEYIIVPYGDMKLVAVYQAGKQAEVTIETLCGGRYLVDGTGEVQSGGKEMVLIGQNLELTAADANKVHHWEDENGRILGTGAELSLKVLKDTTVRLVYEPEEENMKLLTIETVNGMLFSGSKTNWEIRSGGTILVPAGEKIYLYADDFYMRYGAAWTDEKGKDISDNRDRDKCEISIMNHAVIRLTRDEDKEMKLYFQGSDGGFFLSSIVRSYDSPDSIVFPEPPDKPGYLFEKWDFAPYFEWSRDVTPEDLLRATDYYKEMYIIPVYRREDGAETNVKIVHTHGTGNAIYHKAAEATCTKAGNTEYYECSCGKYFSDGQYKNEIAKDSWGIKAIGHNYGEAEYQWAENYQSIDAIKICQNDPSHKVTETVSTTYQVIRQATENDTGIGRYTASFTKSEFTDQTRDVVIPKTEPEKKQVAAIFTDVYSGMQYESAIQFVYDNAFMTGASDTRFDTVSLITRGQFAVILFTIEGSPSTSFDDTRFSDVKSTDYFAEAVMWVVNNGIANGTGANRFSPQQYITREQMMVMFYKYARVKGYAIKSKSNALDGYEDKNKVSSWSNMSMRWAAFNGLLTEKTSGDMVILDPQGKVSRAECAQMIKNFFEKIAK